MRTVWISAGTAFVVAVLVVWVSGPRTQDGAPSKTPERQAEILRRLEALERRAAEPREATAPARLEGSTEAPQRLLRALETRVVQLEEAVEARTREITRIDTALAATDEAREKAAAGKAADEEVQKWLDRLYDDSENVAFSATLELGRLKDPRAVAPLAYVLGTHRDFYVRLGAATALGDIGVLTPATALIDAMGDGDQLVRTAAHDALKKLGGRNGPDFDASAPAADRQEAQAAWRAWFEKTR